MVELQRIRAGSIEIAFRRAGAGVPLLLLHGAVCDGRVWRMEIAEFAGDFLVVAWDAPGCGGSSDLDDSATIADYVDVLEEFVDAVGLDRPIVVGHSFGSTLALELACRSPARLRGLVLVGAYAGWAGSLPGDEVDRRVAAAQDAADAVRSDRWVPASIPDLFSDAMPPDRAAELVACMTDIRAATTTSMARALAACDLRGSLDRVSTPTLIVAGDADRRSPPAVARALHDAIPGSDLAVLPGLGHECFLEDSALFAAAVRPFVRSVSTAP